MVWMVWGLNPGGGEIFRTCPDWPWGPPSPLYNGYQFFPRGKEEQPGRDADPPHPLLVPWSRKSSYASTPPVGCTACTEPQCLYKGALYHLPYLAHSLIHPCVIAERSSGLCHQHLHAQKIYSILYYTYYIHDVILLKAPRWVHMFCMCSSMWHTLYMWCLFFYCYLMAASKELCSICAKPIYGKQDVCDLLHFHCACSQISDTEQVLFTSSGKSSFQCEAYTKPLWSKQNDDMPLRPQHLLSASDATQSTSDGGKNSHLPRRSCIFLNLLAMSLLLLNGRLQDSAGWLPWKWWRILSHWYLLELRNSPI